GALGTIAQLLPSGSRGRHRSDDRLCPPVVDERARSPRRRGSGVLLGRSPFAFASVDRSAGPLTQPPESAPRLGLDLAGDIRLDRSRLADSVTMVARRHLFASAAGILASRPR